MGHWMREATVHQVWIPEEEEEFQSLQAVLCPLYVDYRKINKHKKVKMFFNICFHHQNYSDCQNGLYFFKQ